MQEWFIVISEHTWDCIFHGVYIDVVHYDMIAQWIHM